MKVLIIGNADSIWLKTTIENTISPTQNEIQILSYGNERFKMWYELRGICVTLIPQNRVGKFNMFVAAYQLKERLKNKSYDVMIVHYIRKDFLAIAMQLMPLVQNSIAAFWGSDIFRASKGTIYFNRIALKKFTHINITTDAMLEKFYQDYGHDFDEKISRARFGIDSLCTLKNSLRIQLKDLPVPDILKEKVVVAVGYNGYPAQQHLEAIRALKRIDKEALSGIHLVFRMTYGGTLEYIEKVKSEVEQLGCTYTFFDQYLSDEDSAALTCATDLFVHAQKTDALSASMLEHLYAGAIVFNPVWIPYLELQSQDVFYYKYNTFEELGDRLKTNLVKKEQHSNTAELERMQRYIEKLASWEYLKEEWKLIYHMDKGR